jgi:hypothetical protein
LLLLPPTGYVDGRIDRQIHLTAHSEEDAALKICPHWRSVFSSVFKEPKLRHILEPRLCGLVPVALPGHFVPPWSEEKY